MHSKKAAQRLGFAIGEQIVYPAHGVGILQSIEETEVAGTTMELMVVNFPKNKLTLRLPVAKIKSAGLRKLSDADTVQKALDTLTGRARTKRAIWSRRAQEYDAKINSGDISQVAEVVRDLYREDATAQSYSERQLLETAMERLVDEVGAVNGITQSEATRMIDKQLAKAPKRGGSDAANEQEADAA